MLKIGMVGMGGISHAHVDGWLEIPEAKVICVCDIRPEKADEAAAKTGAKAYYDFDDMLASESFDILDICLPTYLHADFACKALEHDIHVLCEKPISLKREDVARVYGTAKAHGRNVMIAQVVRFWREYEVLKEAYETGKYGKLLSGRMTRLGSTPKSSWDGWMRDPERSGMVPFDLHIHDLDFMIYAFGKPEKMTRFRAGTPTQDYFEAIYQYPDFFVSGEAAWFDCSWRFQCAFRFQFEQAVLEFKDGKLTIFHKNGEIEGLDDNNVEGDGYVPATNAYYNEIRYFVDCVLAGKPCDKIKPEELETVLDLIDQLA
ncbi:MAG: Gfo/Idh/MocA family protein [Candidatus Fimadaptatus sp.]|jgi:predicted dehydrogenase